MEKTSDQILFFLLLISRTIKGSQPSMVMPEPKGYKHVYVNNVNTCMCN